MKCTYKYTILIAGIFLFQSCSSYTSKEESLSAMTYTNTINSNYELVYSSIPSYLEITSTNTITPSETPISTIDIKLLSKVDDIGKLLLTNEDELKDNNLSSWLFQTVDISKQIITKPNDLTLCQLSCGYVSWDNRISITLYYLRDASKANNGIELLKTKLKKQYSYLRITEKDISDPIIEHVMPGYTGWAAIAILNDYNFSEYYVTYIGPIIVVINHKYRCIDGCDVGDPTPLIQLAELQRRKIYRVIGN